MSFHQDFGPFDGRVWMNCAHQGPLPRVAVAAVQEALAWKVAPHRLADDFFQQVPARLKRALGQLVGAPADQIILGNSTSYGLHLLANGFPWRTGDEVLLVEGDFPATLLPWTGLEKFGVKLRQLRPRGGGPTADEVAAQLTPATRLFCATWVNSFTGYALDVEAIGQACRQRGVWFVLNGSQAMGARSLDVSRAPVDAVATCGFKWLCGPYATGFCWMRPELRERLEYNQNYWLAVQASRPLESMRNQPLAPAAGLGAARYDVFCTANFLNFLPWLAAVEYLLAQGIERIAAHDDHLVARLVAGLEQAGFELLSPREGPTRSTLVVASHPDRSRNAALCRQLYDQGIDIALREGNLRFSPHLYNTGEEVDRALSVSASGQK